MSSGRKVLLDRLVRASRSPKNIQEILQDLKSAKPRQHGRPKVIQGVHHGNFFRVTIPPKKSSIPELPKIPSPVGPALKPFKSVPDPAKAAAGESITGTSQSASASKSAAASAAAAAATGGGGGGTERARQQAGKRYYEWFSAWMKENWAILTMNFGSLCTLLAFTRSDVLELRTLSVTASVCFIIYTVAQKPIRWLTVSWTTLFGTVNTYKILQIVNERHSQVKMTVEEEECYTKFFMPNGVTPKQFEAIGTRAERIAVKKGEPLIKQGEKMKYIYLVIKGSTRASVLGRYLTAASTAPVSKEQQQVSDVGHAGAWIGEMAFLESSWGKKEADADISPINKHAPPKDSSHAMYTVVAKEDCVVWRWSHEDMAFLMAKSSDMNAALTRAMTSAIVGKVINFTTSRQSARPSWQTFLDGLKYAPASVSGVVEGGGASSTASNEETKDEENRDDSDVNYPTQESPEAPGVSPA